MEHYPFDISVIMSVYNVEAYIREAVESVIKQTIGFDRVQLVFVDDGSPDGCGAICDEYAAKHPANVLVIHKQNGGLSSARNEGLKHVTGKYVNFLDPDDYIDADAFEKVFRFMEAHPECDVCAIPIFRFGDSTGPDALNNKFDEGTRVIDLLDERNMSCTISQVCAAFYRLEAAANMRFDTVTYSGEDNIENHKTLLNNPHLGVVADTAYHYRRHGESIMAKAQGKKNWYIECMNRYYKAVMDNAERKYGSIPKYVQWTVMDSLQGRFAQSQSIPEGVLTDVEHAEYIRLLYECASRIDDEIIQAHTYLSETRRRDILLHKRADQKGARVEDRVDPLTLGFDFLTFEDGHCVLEGSQEYLCRDADVEPLLLVNGGCVPCKSVRHEQKRTMLLGVPITETAGFRAEIPLDSLPLRVTGALRVTDEGKTTVIQTKRHIYRYFFPISEVYDNASYIHGNYIVTVRDGALVIDKKPTFSVRAVREVRWLKEIWQKNMLGGRKAVIARLYYHLVKPFKRRRLWLFMDRYDKADDNAEALYRYYRKHQPKNTRMVFAVRKDSADRPALEKLGACVEPFSLRHKLLHLMCDMEISSHQEPFNRMFRGYHDPLRDLLQHQKNVFLQHGIIKDDLSNQLSVYSNNVRGFVTTAERERQSVVQGDYGYSEEAVWLTGMPRHDRLYRDEQRIVTVMPTWRSYLFKKADEKGDRPPIDDFTESAFFRFFDEFLHSKRLMDALESMGYRLQFFPHPVVQVCAQMFHLDPRVKLVPLETPYRDVFAQSDLVVTDYTSAVFDFAYLRKPTIYCQFDKEDFFGKHYAPGYFSYEHDGFGEVEYTLEATIDRIIEYVQNGCRMKDEYRRRADAFFAFSDQNNCARVAEKIEQLASETQ